MDSIDIATEKKSSITKSFWKRFDISTLAILGIAFLTPLFFVPLDIAPFQFSKTLLVVVLVIVALIFFLQKTIRRGEFSFEWNPLLVSLYALPVAYLVSALFSPQTKLGLFGYQLGQDTFGFMLVAAVLTHTTVLVLHRKQNMFSVFTALLFASWVVFAFQFFQFFFGGSVPLSFLSVKTGNLIGRWNDLGLFAGLIFSLILLALESLMLSKKHHTILSVTSVVALIILWVVNMQEVWWMVGVASFVVLVFALAQRFFMAEQPEVRWSGVLPTIGLLIALFSLSVGSGLATTTQNILGVSALEVRPSFSSTIDVLSGVYKASPLVGSGPNTFSSQWLLYRSPDIVQTPFWNLSFTVGANTILSSMATGGLIVSLAWLVFLLLLVYSVTRALFTVDANNRERYFLTSMSAGGVIYLLFAHLIYTPSQSLTTLFFLFVGLFVASLYDTKLVHVFSVSLRKTPRTGFTFMLGGILILLASLVSVYGVARQYVGVVYHNQALAYANAGNLQESLNSLGRAVQLDDQDQYYRTAALVYLAQANQIIAAGKNDAPAQTAFQNALASSVQATGLALERNKNSFENTMTRGLVFSSVVPLNIDGAYDNAVSTYEAARVLNPLDPEVDLRLAQMDVARNDIESARVAIARALSKKADYTDAILLLAQIELDAGNLTQAITSVKNAVFFEPQNSVLLYQLGILLLQNESYDEATSAFELALQQTPDFANASFFLAQAYAFLARFDDAEALMTQLVEKNPDNELVKQYAKTLAGGKNPFVTTPVPLESSEDEVIE